MDEALRGALLKLKEMLATRIDLHRMILFGSSARGEAGPDSDVDLIVVLKDSADADAFETVSDCAWEIGFDHGLVIVPIIYTQDEWENGPERHSLLASAVASDGVAV
jgi:uncharacterized protein